MTSNIQLYSLTQLVRSFLNFAKKELFWDEEKVAQFLQYIEQGYTPLEAYEKLDDNPRGILALAKFTRLIFKVDYIFTDEVDLSSFDEHRDDNLRIYYSDREGNLYFKDPLKFVLLIKKAHKGNRKTYWILPLPSNWNVKRKIQGGSIVVYDEAYRFWIELIVRAVRNGWGDIYLDASGNAYKVAVRNEVGEKEILNQLSVPEGETEIRKLLSLTPLGQEPMEKRIPGDTSISFSEISKKEVQAELKNFLMSLQENKAEADLRISILPTKRGFTLDVRVLPKRRSIVPELRLLGYKQEHEEKLLAALKLKQGLVIVSGPTGSGKSTLLYWLMKNLNPRRRRIISIEDPVEITIPDIQQIEVKRPVYDENGKVIGIDFALALRTILRQNPDVIIVGETRDRETAKKVIEAANTGHLVATTIHANDELLTIQRLVDLIVDENVKEDEAWKLALSQIKMVIAQRLIPKVCKKCLEEGKITKVNLTSNLLREYPSSVKEALAEYVDNDYEIIPFVPESANCNECKGGYEGRIPVLGILEITPELRDYMIRNRQNLSYKEFRVKAEGITGFKSLVNDAVQRLLDGDITLDDFAKVI